MSLHRAGMAPTFPDPAPCLPVRAGMGWGGMPYPPPRRLEGATVEARARVPSGPRCLRGPMPVVTIRRYSRPIGGLDRSEETLSRLARLPGRRGPTTVNTFALGERALATQRLATLPRVDSSPIVGCVTPHGFSMSGQVRVSTAQAPPEGAEGEGDAQPRLHASRRLTEYVSSQKPSNKGECVARIRTPSGCFRPVPSALNARVCP